MCNRMTEGITITDDREGGDGRVRRIDNVPGEQKQTASMLPIRWEDATHRFRLHFFQFLDFLNERPNCCSEVVYLPLKRIDVAPPRIRGGSVAKPDPSGDNWSRMRMSHRRYDGGGESAGRRR